MIATVPDEVLSVSGRSRVVRRSVPGGTIVCKEPLGPDAARRVRYETGMLERLAAVAGVVKLSTAAHAPNVIALVDDRAVSLASILHVGRFDPAALPELIGQFAATLSGMHRIGIVHRNITPTNIVMADAARRPILIDFRIATSSAEERPGFATRSEIDGSSAYMAPEQTGRTGRVVDLRADLYSLGATLYEMATGHVPFAGDDFQVVRDQLLRVAIPPATFDPAIPLALSNIIMRLLEKAPERRYQGAEGLAADVSRFSARLARGETAPFPLAENDFPQRLLPPSRIVGRDTEVVALTTAFTEAIAGRGKHLLIAGASGVGKAVLANELRALVTVRGGWFVSGKFDRYRRDTGSDAVAIALRALWRLLLAEPEAEAVRLRKRLLRAIGDAAPFVGALFPDAAAFLDVAPAVGSPDALKALLNSSASALGDSVEMLKCIASADRPLVFVVEDLQWASDYALALVNAVVTAAPSPGLLLVVTYRPADIGSQVAAMFDRWDRLHVLPPRIELENLGLSGLALLLAGMLRLDPVAAARLADVVFTRTDGNPYDTIELVNALRRDGALMLGSAGWTWDDATIRRYVGHGDVADLLAIRIAAMPPNTRALLETAAYLGGDLPFGLLAVASALPEPADVESALKPALDDGLIVAGERSTIRFRHDRVQQAAYDLLAPPERRRLQLVVARRLTAASGFEAFAAEQYLAVVADIGDADERARVVGLFQRAAQRERAAGNDLGVERYAGAALEIMRVDPASDDVLAESFQIDRHAALYRLGRLSEADVPYAALVRRGGDPLRTIDSACLQISSLTNRKLGERAMTLGIDVLASIGFVAPTRDKIDAVVNRQLEEALLWCDRENSEALDLERAETNDPRVVAAANILNSLMAPALFLEDERIPWLVFEGFRLWTTSGPCAGLVGPMSYVGPIMIDARADYTRAYRMSRRVLRASESRAYRTATAHSRLLFAVGMAHWFESFADCIVQARLAHEELIGCGDLQSASFTYFATIQLRMAMAPSIADFLGEAEAAIAFCLRTGNDRARGSFLAYRRLATSLTASADPGRPVADDAFEAEDRAAGLIPNPFAILSFHITRGFGALLAGDVPALVRHADAAMPLLNTIRVPSTALVYVLLALARARQMRSAPAGEHANLLADLDRSLAWLRARAVDSPEAYSDAVLLVAAERAWSLGDATAASAAFETALLRTPVNLSPWHRAYLEERAAVFYLGHGLMRYGRTLLGDAREHYSMWGASAKVGQLESAYPFLRDVPVAYARRPLDHGPSELVDMPAILRASQALSSETSLAALRARVGEVLAGLTGATAVNLAVWRDDTQQWRFLHDNDRPGAALTLDEAGAKGLVPLSAFRVVERTREPLVSGDAMRDDRFARDPYFAGCEQCSLLVVPILSRGAMRAMLFLENRDGRDAFSTNGLDIVMLLAGQLAVSIDNALMYASLEENVATRTAALAAANQQLALLSRTDGLTGLVNRRGFDEQLALEWHRAQRMKTPLGLVMADIDNFKAYNDTYGHLAGDLCLKRISAALAAGVRPGVDVAARYGGEEFAFILPGSDLDGTFSAAERLRVAIAALRDSDASGTRRLATISMGVVSVVPAAGEKATDYLAKADAALYRAKAGGRDAVMRA